MDAKNDVESRRTLVSIAAKDGAILTGEKGPVARFRSGLYQA
jgi:hypothetical protein